MRHKVRDIILVASDEPPRIIRTPIVKDIIMYLGENNLVNSLPIEIKFVTFRDGKCGALLIAADHFVSNSEALKLHYELDIKYNSDLKNTIKLHKIK